MHTQSKFPNRAWTPRSRLNDLRDELGISDNQQDIWDAFAETLDTLTRELARVDSKPWPSPHGSAPALVAVLEARQERLAIERNGIRELIEVSTLLYRSLTSAQRKRADRLLRPLCISLDQPVPPPRRKLS